MSASTWLTGHFLIAMPTLQDPNFARGVAYLCHHDAQGALGLLINRPSGMRLRDLLRHLDITLSEPAYGEQAVLIGGPVSPEVGFVLHERNGEWESSLAVGERLCLTTSRDVLAAIARGEGPRRHLVALGYAGWSAGQLEREMLENAWLAVPADERVLFEAPLERRWEEAAALVGVRIGDLGHWVGHA